MCSLARSGLALSNLLALTAALGCGGGFDSPEACFQSIQVAAHNEDMRGICNCLTDESQESLAGMLVMAGSMVSRMPPAMLGPTGSDAAKQTAEAIQGVMNQHGLTNETLSAKTANPLLLASPGGIRDLASLVTDKQGFIADMYAALKSTGQGAQFGEQFEQQIAGTLKDVKIDGDQATAKVVTASGEEPLLFRKTPAGWKLHINLTNAGAPA